jgi:hypothetical protein
MRVPRQRRVRTALPAFVAPAPTPVRSALPDPINASPAACSFTSPKTGPTKAKNSLPSQLPPCSPVRLRRLHAARPEGVMVLSRVRSRVRREYPGYGVGHGTPARPQTRSMTVHSWRNLGIATRARPALRRIFHLTRQTSCGQLVAARQPGAVVENADQVGSRFGCHGQEAGRTDHKVRAALHSAPSQPRPVRPPPRLTKSTRSPPAPDRQPAGVAAFADPCQGLTLDHLYNFCKNASRANPPKDAMRRSQILASYYFTLYNSYLALHDLRLRVCATSRRR